jgi:hypothetical protein
MATLVLAGPLGIGGGAMTHLGDRMREGAAAGLAATAAMSAFMWSAQRAGFVGEQAPKQLMRRSLEAVGDHPSGARLSAISLVAHFAFGAAAGAAYGGLSDRLPTGRSTLYSGVAFGLAVWAATYKVAFPPLHLMPPPERDRPGRARTMILAHVVYGAVLGARLDRWREYMDR